MSEGLTFFCVASRVVATASKLTSRPLYRVGGKKAASLELYMAAAFVTRLQMQQACSIHGASEIPVKNPAMVLTISLFNLYSGFKCIQAHMLHAHAFFRVVCV